MKKILFLFFILSSISFSIGEEKYGFAIDTKYEYGFSTKLDLKNKNGEVSKVFISGFYDFGTEGAKESKIVYKATLDNFITKDTEILEVFNDGHREFVYINADPYILYGERYWGEVRFVALLTKSKKSDNIKKHNSQVIEYVMLNGILTQKKVETLKKYALEY